MASLSFEFKLVARSLVLTQLTSREKECLLDISADRTCLPIFTRPRTQLSNEVSEGYRDIFPAVRDLGRASGASSSQDTDSRANTP